MIPIVDFSRCGLQNSDEDITGQSQRDIGSAICEAFKTSGFVYLTNHGVPKTKVQKVKDVSGHFFQLPMEIKKCYARSQSDANFGYAGLEVEKVSAERPGDLKEVYDMTPNQEDESKWPDKETPELKGVMWGMFRILEKLSLRILHVMGIGLNLEDPELFVKFHSDMIRGSATTLRTLYYPPLPSHFEVKPNQIRCGEHSDYGSITLLFQDQVGGLQVMNRQGEYIPATPIEDSLLVNVGDLMQRWTADLLVSTMHRVLIPVEEMTRRQARQSLVFFVRPDDAKVIECIDGSNKYTPITSLEYTNQRFAATFVDIEKPSK